MKVAIALALVVAGIIVVATHKSEPPTAPVDLVAERCKSDAGSSAADYKACIDRESIAAAFERFNRR